MPFEHRITNIVPSEPGRTKIVLCEYRTRSVPSEQRGKKGLPSEHRRTKIMNTDGPRVCPLNIEGLMVHPK